MRRSIAAVLFAVVLILLAAGCRVTGKQKQAAARALTSVILNSVFLIQSQGHHQNDRGASADIGTSSAAQPASEIAGPEPVWIASLGDPAANGDSRRTADEAPCTKPAPGNAAVAESSLPESPQVISTTAIDVVASRLTPAPAPDALPLPTQIAGSLPIEGRLNLEALTAGLRSAAAPRALKTVLSHTANAVVVCSTEARRVAVQEIEHRGNDRPRVRIRIASRFEAGKSRRMVIIERDGPIDEQELSRLVENSLVLVTTAPSH